MYLGRRPLKLVRHSHHTTFYHKGPLPPVPDAVHQLRIEKLPYLGTGKLDLRKARELALEMTKRAIPQ